MFNFPDIFGTRRRAAVAQEQALVSSATVLAAERTELGEKLFEALKKAAAARPSQGWGVWVGKFEKNAGCYSIICGLTEPSGRKLSTIDGCVGQFDIKLDNTSFLVGEGPFHAHLGKWGPDEYVDDFEAFMNLALETVRNFK